MVMSIKATPILNNYEIVFMYSWPFIHIYIKWLPVCAIMIFWLSIVLGKASKLNRRFRPVVIIQKLLEQ